MSTCIVRHCTNDASTRNLCAHHFALHRTHGNIRQGLPDEHEPLVCVCTWPRPDAIGQCDTCARLVVTFAHANVKRYRDTYPDEWNRAVRLRAVPNRKRGRR
jgi:hypothetical protein